MPGEGPGRILHSLSCSVSPPCFVLSNYNSLVRPFTLCCECEVMLSEREIGPTRAETHSARALSLVCKLSPTLPTTSSLSN